MVLFMTGCGETSTSQQLPSWETQLSFAQKKAREVAPDVVLESVMTYRLPFKPPPDDHSYEVHFRFLNESGNIVDVSFVNTQMAETVFVIEALTESHPSIEEQKRREQVISTIQIGPEEAIEQTQTEVEAFATKYEHIGVELTLFITSSDEAQQARGAAAVWLVTYSEPSYALYDETAKLLILVDAQTGAILE